MFGISYSIGTGHSVLVVLRIHGMYNIHVISISSFTERKKEDDERRRDLWTVPRTGRSVRPNSQTSLVGYPLEDDGRGELDLVTSPSPCKLPNTCHKRAGAGGG